MGMVKQLMRTNPLKMKYL